MLIIFKGRFYVSTDTHFRNTDLKYLTNIEAGSLNTNKLDASER